MKKVIITTVPENSITLEEVLAEDNPIVAFQIPKRNAYFEGIKVALVRTGYKTPLYQARCVKSWEKGNGFDSYGVADKTIQDWVIFFEKYHNTNMFVFDSPQELFQWLAE